MGRKVYRSKFDLWLVIVIAASLMLVWYSAMGMSWVYITFVCGGTTLLYFLLSFGCWYEIDGNVLVIYRLFQPVRIPVSEIKSVRKTAGYLATAGMSHIRVSIRLTFPNKLKISGPIEISPRDRDGFISDIVTLNPEIEVMR